MSDQAPQRPTSDEDREGWKAYWVAVDMPWRTEPEIDAERQRFLMARRAVQPDIKKGLYPFRDENGSIRLMRRDVEWLLATHESGGHRGPVNWDDGLQRQRNGLDLRGANLQEENLAELPLSRTLGGLDGSAEYDRASMEQRDWAGLNLRQAVLNYARLEGARLSHARMEGVQARQVRFESTELYRVNFEAETPADFSFSSFDAKTRLDKAIMGNKKHVGPRFRGVQWTGTDLSYVDFSHVRILEDERLARTMKRTPKVQGKRDERTSQYQRAVQAYTLLADTLRTHSLSRDADRFAYRAHLCQQYVLRRQGKVLPYLGSIFLWALAGYGYRIWRIFLAYTLVLLAFAVIYVAVGLPNQQGLSTLQSFANALQVSLTAIHGRVFFEQFGIGSGLAWVAAVESVAGIVIEGVFVAMLIQRFFAR